MIGWYDGATRTRGEVFTFSKILLQKDPPLPIPGSANQDQSYIFFFQIDVTLTMMNNATKLVLESYS